MVGYSEVQSTKAAARLIYLALTDSILTALVSGLVSPSSCLVVRLHPMHVILSAATRMTD